MMWPWNKKKPESQKDPLKDVVIRPARPAPKEVQVETCDYEVTFQDGTIITVQDLSRITHPGTYHDDNRWVVFSRVKSLWWAWSDSSERWMQSEGIWRDVARVRAEDIRVIRMITEYKKTVMCE